MKKTLVALAVTAFAASASAVTVYDNEGTKVETYGQLRLLLDNSGASKKNADGTKTTTKRHHTNLKNDGTRFGMRIKHDINEDLFAFGRFELRFNGTNTKVDEGEVVADNTADSFGSVYAHRAYVGLGSKTFGEIAFGRQETIGDDIARAGFDKTYGVTNTPLTKWGASTIRYDYKGIKGLQVGVDYRFAENRDEKSGEVLEETYKSNGTVDKKYLKSGYGAGAIYEFGVADGQSMSVAAGYTRDNYKTTTVKRHHRDAAMAGVSYTIGDLKVAFDYGYSLEKAGLETGGSWKKHTHGLQTGAKYQFTPAIAVYGNYVYWNGKTKTEGVTTSKDKTHRFMLGTEYQLHKNVLTFVEGRVQRDTTTTYTSNGSSKTRATDKVIGVGLRVLW